MRFFFLFSFFSLFLVILSSGYADLPPILEDPGEPDMDVPVPPPPETAVPVGEEGAAGGGGGLGGNISGNESSLPAQESPAAVPEGVVDGVAGVAGDDLPGAPGEGVVVGGSERSGLARPGFVPEVSPKEWYYAGIAALVVVSSLVILVLHRKHRRSLPSRLRKF